MKHVLIRVFWRFCTEVWGIFMRAYRWDTRPADAIGYRQWAERKLSRFARDFIFTENRNRPALDGLSLIPRVAVDVSEVDIRYSVFGQSLASPIGLSPAGAQLWLHPLGERATSAGLNGHVGMFGTMATQQLERIAEAATGPLWFQLYVQHDFPFTLHLIDRALTAGFSALCITLDTPVASIRPGWGKYAIPAWAVAPNLRDAPIPPLASGIGPRISPAVSWKTIEALRKRYQEVPLVLKGILHPDDARMAEETGASAVLVSNHGGRQLFGSVSPVTMFPAIRAATSIPLYVDGGIQSGIDVLKVLALGADMTFVGSSYLCALAHSGTQGVAHILRLLDTELIRAMRLCGVTKLSDINRSLLGG